MPYIKEGDRVRNPDDQNNKSDRFSSLENTMSKSQNLELIAKGLSGFLRSLLGLEALEQMLIRNDQALTQINGAIGSFNDRLIILEDNLMLLADKIKSLVAIETEEGKKLLEKNAALQTELESAKASLEEVKAIAATVPNLESKVAELQSHLDAASLAADEIAAINPTPVSDQIVDEVKSNPEIPTPPVVDEAPAPTPDTVPDLEVVEEAIDAIAEFG